MRCAGSPPAISPPREAFENAIASVAATGGSTNAVLHLLAMAHEAGVRSEDRRFPDHQRAHAPAGRSETGGTFVALDVDKAGGWPVVAKRLVDGGYVDRDAMTVTGRTFAEEAADAKETAGQEVIRPLDNPIKISGRPGDPEGNLAPEGSVIKVTGIERRRPSRSGARVRSRRRRDARRHQREDQSRATWW